MLARRTFRPAMFESFDAPDGIQSCSRRVESNTAPQSLTLLNGQWTVKEVEPAWRTNWPTWRTMPS